MKNDISHCHFFGQNTDTQLRWSAFEKEAFSFMATTERINWLTSCHEVFGFYSEHKNLVIKFNLMLLVPDQSQNLIRQVMRWAVRLSI